MAADVYQWDISCLEKLKNSRVFLTGGTGFFGKWLLRFFVETFEELSIEVTVLSRDPVRFQENHPEWGCAPNISWVKGDVRSFEFPVESFDYIIHAATPVGRDTISYDSSELYSIIVEGTEHVLDFVEASQTRRLLHVSSGAVYGIQPPELSHIDESTPCMPVHSYGKGKLRSEELCKACDCDVVIARCFAFVGEYFQKNNHFAIGNFILDCMHNRPIEVQGDGTPLRSYMYGADLVTWLLCMLVHGSAGEVYNVGSDAAISIEEVASVVKKALNGDSEILIQQAADPSLLPNRYVPSIEKATKELGLSVKVGLEEAIIATERDWRAQEDAV